MNPNIAYEEAFADKKVMVTGGLGFIGSNLAHRLVELGAEVLLVDSLIPDYGGNLFNVHDIQDRVRVNIADVRTESSMNYLVQGQDYIFALAGQVSHLDSMQDPYTDLEINCRSQLTILEACRKHNPTVKLVYAGTRQQYGKPRYLPVDEEHLMNPTDVNGINKMAGEWYYIVYNNVYGLRAISLRLTNTYGPRQLMKHPRQGFIAWFILKAFEGETIELFGGGSQIRDLTYVDDVVEAFLMAATRDDVNGQVFNLGGLEPISLLELTKLIIEIAGTGRYTVVPFPVERQAIDIGDFYADYSKIKGVLGWQPKVPLREGLGRTIEYYRRYRHHYWGEP